MSSPVLPYQTNPMREFQFVPISAVRNRATTHATRAMRPLVVIELAESIEAIGLLQPIVVDVAFRLLAGEHRLTALRLLAEPDPQARESLACTLLRLDPTRKQDTSLLERVAALEPQTYPFRFPRGIPVVRFALCSVAEPELALGIEVAENEKRHDYTPDEILALYDRLVQSGRYRVEPGRPAQDKPSAQVALSRIVGKHKNTIKRLLAQRKMNLDKCVKTGPCGPVFTHLDRISVKLAKEITGFLAEVAAQEAAGRLTPEQARRCRGRIEQASAAARPAR